MAADVGGLIGDIGLNVAGLRQDVNQANRELRRGTNRMNRQLGKMRKGVDRVTKGFKLLAGAVAAGALVRLGSNALEAADSVGKLAEQAGFGVERIQTLRFAAEQSGVEARIFDDGIKRLNRRLGLFINDGGGPAAKAFETLGIETAISRGELQTAEQVFDEATKRLGNIDSKARRAALASQLFGEDAGPRLALLLGKGTEGVSKLEQKSRDLGGVLSEDVTKNAADVRDRFNEVSKAISVTFTRALVNAGPYIVDFLNIINTTVRGMDALFQRFKAISDASRTELVRRRDDLLEQRQRFKDMLSKVPEGAPEPKNLTKSLKQVEDRLAKVNTQLRKLDKASLDNFLAPPSSIDDSVKNTFGNGSTKINSAKKELEGFAGLTGRFALELKAAETQTEDYNAAVQRKIEIERKGKNQLTGFAGQTGEFALELQAAETQTKDYNAAVRRTMKESKDGFNELKSAVDGWHRDFVDRLIDGERTFKGFVDTIVLEMARIAAAEATKPLFNAASSFLSNIFSGGRATGGPVSAGRMYEVNERGPELLNVGDRQFLMMGSQGGNVTPSSGGSSAPITVNQSFDFSGANPATAQMLRQQAEQIKSDTIQTIADMQRRGAWRS